MEELQLLDYLSILKRRRKIFFAVAAGIFLLSALFALNWSNYRSIATVEIAQSEISDSMAAPTGSNLNSVMESLADLRISRLEQKVLSTGSLIEMITKFDLYANSRKTTPIAEIANIMRKKIRIQLVSSPLANPASAQRVSASQLSAIAFKLSFDYDNALLAQQVTNELVSHFLDEDLKERRRQAKETSAFLEQQIKILEESLKEQEKQIAEFLAKNGDVRPETLTFNQQGAATTMMNLQNIESRLEANLGTQGVLRGQLATVDPYSRVMAEGQLLTTPTIQLKTLQSDYASLTAKYGPQHPDVLKAKRQIKALESQLSDIGGTGALQATIIDIRAKLKTEEKTYGAENPEVISLRNQLKNLEAQMASASKESNQQNSLKQDADNPAYLQLVAQLRSTEEQYKALTTQRNALQAQLNKYQLAVLENPKAEQKLAELTRDYENSKLRYRDLKTKKMSADMSATIEEDRSGQKLVVIDPPELPHKTQPSRFLFLAIGFFASLMAGLVSVIGLQLISQSVVGPRHLQALIGTAPLVTIPHLITTEEKNKTMDKRLYILGAGVAGIILLLFLFSSFVMPLEVLWSVLLRRIGLS